MITWDLPGWQKDKLSDAEEKLGFNFHDFTSLLPTKKSSEHRLPDGHLTPKGYGVVANKTYGILEEKYLTESTNE